jgi:hypothetical protein
MGNLVRAKIYQFKQDDSSYDVNDPIDVCFNPKEYSLEKSVTWESEKAHSDAPMPEFKKPTPMTMSVTLQFDTYEERVSVRDKYMRRIESLAMMRADPKNEKDPKKHSPPVILFVWGNLKFKGVVETLSQRYTMFLSDGTPVRSECTLKIRNVVDSTIDDKEAAAVKKGRGGKTYRVKQGDRLDLIAAKELGDASRWAEIAMLNGIDDPLQDLSGRQTLKLPSGQ